MTVLLRLECLAVFGGPSLSPGCNITSGLNLPRFKKDFSGSLAYIYEQNLY